MNLTFGSLFSGVGGFDKGFLRNEWECKWMVEFDKSAAGVLAHHYPDVPLHCDVTKVDADELEVPHVCLAGFPCQDVSQAGLRKGLNEGTRSNLFFEAVRIIQRLRARGDLRYALFENVPGLFSVDDGIGFARCIRELLDVGSSDVGWTVLDAQNVGWCTSEGRRIRSVPQRRRRVFICASFGDTGEATTREIFSFSSRMSRNTQTRGEEGEGTPASFTEGVGAGCGEVAGTVSSKWHKGTGGPSGDECYNLVSTQGVDVYNGQMTGEVAASVTSASGISNATGPKVIGFRRSELRLQGKLTSVDIAPTLKSETKCGDTELNVCYEGEAYCLQGGGETSQNSQGSGVNKDVSFTLNGLDKHGVVDVTEPAVCSWNGDITPKSAEDVSVTLRSQQGGEGTGIAMPMVVRRLTPKECCRLQAWEDDHLDVREDLDLQGNTWIATGKKIEQADSAKYKQAGNGVASNCAEWIARRMRHVLER